MEDRVTGHQLHPPIEVSLGVGDSEFGGDHPDLVDAHRIAFGQHHPGGNVEADARTLLQRAVSGDGRIRQNRPLPTGVEPTGDPPRVVVAAKRTSVEGEHGWFGHPDTDHLHAAPGQMPQCRRPHQPQPDNTDSLSHAGKIVTGGESGETGDRGPNQSVYHRRRACHHRARSPVG